MLGYLQAPIFAQTGSAVPQLHEPSVSSEGAHRFGVVADGCSLPSPYVGHSLPTADAGLPIRDAPADERALPNPTSKPQNK